MSVEGPSNEDFANLGGIVMGLFNGLEVESLQLKYLKLVNLSSLFIVKLKVKIQYTKRIISLFS